MGAQTAFTYNKNGQIATVTDADGGITQYNYDACGNLIQTTDPMGNVVQYAYDAMNNQIKECRLSEEGEQTHITLYQYDKRGGMIREIDPLLAEKTYTYDGSGNIISMVDEEENETTVCYNLNHLPVQINYYNGRCDNGSQNNGSQNNGSQNNDSQNNGSQNNGSQNNGSPINSKEVKFRYNSRGELVEMKDWNGTAVLEHDSLGRLTKITDHNNRSTGYSYDPAGKRILSNVIHEGTHALDYIHKYAYRYPKSVWSWEKRAYFFERQFQIATGRKVRFETIDDMLVHIQKYYPNKPHTPYKKRRRKWLN